MAVPCDERGLDRSACLTRLLLAGIALFACAAACANAAEVRVVYLRAPESKARLSLIDLPADDDGLAGGGGALGGKHHDRPVSGPAIRAGGRARSAGRETGRWCLYGGGCSPCRGRSSGGPVADGRWCWE